MSVPTSFKFSRPSIRSSSDYRGIGATEVITQEVQGEYSELPDIGERDDNPLEAVRFTEQELNVKQQTRARENINALRYDLAVYYGDPIIQ